MISKSKIASMISVGFFLLTTGAAGLAHTPSDPSVVGNLKILIPSSGMIFHGQVTKVEYVKATQVGGGIVPHAFVTYSFSEILYPNSETNRTSIIVRFIGGPDGQGRFLDVEGVPKFSVGDEDILFLRSNGTDGCAIVTCEFGRYRVLDSLVYEAHGSPVKAIGTAKISTDGVGPSSFSRFIYPTPSFDELMKNPNARDALKRSGLSVEAARVRYASEAPKEMVISEYVGAVTDPPPVQYGFSITTFKRTLREAILLLALQNPTQIIDANPSSQIVLPVPTAVAPGK